MPTKAAAYWVVLGDELVSLGQRCARCDNKATVTKFTMLFGYTMEVVKRS